MIKSAISYDQFSQNLFSRFTKTTWYFARSRKSLPVKVSANAVNLALSTGVIYYLYLTKMYILNYFTDGIVLIW